MLYYRAEVVWMDEEKYYLVTFPDFEGTIVWGDTLGEALENGKTMLHKCLEFRLSRDTSIPTPSFDDYQKDSLFSIPVDNDLSVYIISQMMKEQREKDVIK